MIYSNSYYPIGDSDIILVMNEIHNHDLHVFNLPLHKEIEPDDINVGVWKIKETKQ